METMNLQIFNVFSFLTVEKSHKRQHGYPSCVRWMDWRFTWAKLFFVKNKKKSKAIQYQEL